MIKIEKVSIVGWHPAMRGMRNPMNSWDRSDSECLFHMYPNFSEDDPKAEEYERYLDEFNINLKLGPNDHALMEKLVKGGPVHAKFRRMITVYVDITAPLYWWKEFDTYKVGTVANSCSTMHKIHEKEFTMDDFSCEHLLDSYLGEDRIANMDVSDEDWTPMNVLDFIKDALNHYRNLYIATKDKKYWWQMIQLLPSSYNQKRTVMLNYEVLANIYEWRKNHKLDEWVKFCHWIETLPYSEIIVGEPKTEVAYLCGGERCNPCNSVYCTHTLDIKHAVNFEKVDDHKYIEKEHNPLAHPETYVADAIDMIGDMTEAQRVEVMKYLKVKTPEECPYWDYEEHKSLGTCNGCEEEDHGIIINGDRYCNIVSPTKEEE